MLTGVTELVDPLRDEFRFVHPDPDSYWPAWAHDDSGNSACVEALRALEGGEITLGFYAMSHIGDVLCMSGLPRKLSMRFGCKVYSVRHRSTYSLLANNPHLAGYRNTDRIALGNCLAGPGHIIQKLERFFGLPVDPIPKPEVHLTDKESKWAWEIRRMLPRNRPVVLVCANSVTDGHVDAFGRFGWQRWIDRLGESLTVVQLALTDLKAYEQIAVMSARHRSRWQRDRIHDNCFVLENLSPRMLVAIFSVADFYLGTNAGGAHLAAAFNIPSVVVLNRRFSAERLRFPNPDLSSHTAESFLYPQHTFGFPIGDN